MKKILKRNILLKASQKVNQLCQKKNLIIKIQNSKINKENNVIETKRISE